MDCKNMPIGDAGESLLIPFRDAGDFPSCDGRRSAQADSGLAPVRQSRGNGRRLHGTSSKQSYRPLVAGITHDLKNLLWAARMHVGLARELLRQEHPARERLAVIDQALQQGADLAQSLMGLAGRPPLDRTPVNLSDLVCRASTLIRGIMSPAVDVVTCTPEEFDIWVEGDPTQLRQTLMNLVDNARQAMPQGGRLTIILRARPAADLQQAAGDECADQVAELTVADTGVGMTEEVRGRMFEPFFSRKGHGGANGMGLWLVQGVVADHDGHIAVRSVPGMGTEFSIRLPLRCLTTRLQPGRSPHHTPRGQGALDMARRLTADQAVSPRDAARVRGTVAQRSPRGRRGWKTRR
ncbi:MAG: HAMP domain-containing histidine kinase [Phycisphaerales bacterium]|nr:MAG: HAMP domain-containing histidine kinase [Phycisphaerales bacterium]